MITTVAELEAIYGPANPRSLQKEIDHINADYRAFVEASPFVVIATAGPEGLDCSPKGDAPGFVQLLDERTLAIPDRPGNNRIDNLRNIVRDPHISVLFIIPGIGETLRVNGQASISAEPELLARFTVQGKQPKTVILVKAESVYFHCAKAFARSNLWDPERFLSRSALPSTGSILQRLSQNFDGAAYDRELPERTRTTLY